MQEYPDELEADLLEFFQVDILDFWRGRLSLRRIGVLIKSLLRKPGRSLLLQALDEKAEWDEPTYLLARSSDALELTNHLLLKAHFDPAQTKDLALPPKIPRPGEDEPAPEVEMSSPQEVMSLFQAMNSL
ncbi:MULTISPECIES: hypothetical protein [unclassified Streptomyces]|uniref:hypothetical protein n=1 Tax=unclassified Streptomyces TaxID=2593676 RepID=UPI001F0C9148|nr:MULTISPECIES: hypothetical protein [unclassified Streptomyces]